MLILDFAVFFMNILFVPFTGIFLYCKISGISSHKSFIKLFTHFFICHSNFSLLWHRFFSWKIKGFFRTSKSFLMSLKKEQKSRESHYAEKEFLWAMVHWRGWEIPCQIDVVESMCITTLVATLVATLLKTFLTTLLTTLLRASSNPCQSFATTIEKSNDAFFTFQSKDIDWCTPFFLELNDTKLFFYCYRQFLFVKLDSFYI